MNCQDWTELMQRNMDGDLNAHEHALLMDHMKHCPDCRDMHERLTRLSHELDNLPEVVPAYSLVDAILPRLAQLDLAAESMNARADEPPLSAGSSGRSDDLASMRPETAIGRIERRKWRKWGGGIATAAAVVAVFIAVYNSPDINNGKLSHTAADMAPETKTASQFSVAAPAAGMSSKEAASGSESADGSTYSTSMPETEPKPLASESTDPASEAEATQSEDAPDESVGIPKAKDGLDTSDGLDGEMSISGFDEGSPASGGEDQPNVSGEDQPDAGARYDASGGNAGISGETTDSMAIQGTEDADAAESPAIAQNMSLSFPSPIIPGPIQIESNDGQYSAVAVGYTIKIFNEESEQLFETERKNGRITELAWSEDSSELTYVVELEQGGREKYRIVTSTWEDEKAPAE